MEIDLEGMEEEKYCKVTQKYYGRTQILARESAKHIARECKSSPQINSRCDPWGALYDFYIEIVQNSQTLKIPELN